MSVQVKRRRDTAANIAAFTPAQGELIVDTTNNRVVVGDGATSGGWPAAKLSEIVTASRTPVADANYSAQSTDRLIAYTAITAARTVTIPAATAFPVGVLLWIADQSGACSSTKAVTIASVGADTIDGAASVSLNGAYDAIAIASDGASHWTVLSSPPNQQFSQLGVGTAPDSNNPLSVYGGTNGAALFNGSNFSFTVNKSAATNIASIIFEDNFSLRAQFGLLNNDNLTFKVSPNGSSYFNGLTLDSTTGSATFGNARTAVSDTNYTALSTDREIAYTAVSAARTVTLPSAGAFPAGHALVIVDESGAAGPNSSITIARAGTDLISGQTTAKIVTAYGHVRLFSNGANGWVVTGRSINVQTFSASGTYTPTAGMTRCDVFLVGGGGGGGGGALQAASAASSGGAGGGAGGVALATLTAALVGASQSLTIGSGGAGGTAATASTSSGGAGGNGGATSFGSILKALGGGGGAGGQLAGNSGGGGGGSPIAAGAAGSGGTGGGAGLGGTAGGGGANSAALSSHGGGTGGGGGVNGAAGAGSGSNLFGPSGGAAGGGVSAANVSFAGGASGFAPTGALYQNAPGGAAGAAGGPGVAPSLSPGFLGTGGGGGGSATSGGAGSGGAGAGGGGGGGGGSAQNGGTAGAGGAGGAGYAIVIEYF